MTPFSAQGGEMSMEIKPYDKFLGELETGEALTKMFPNRREYERFISTARQVCIKRDC